MGPVDGTAEEEADYVNHVIELLTLARKQYKHLRCTRMTRWLAVQIADQYRDAHQHERALLYVSLFYCLSVCVCVSVCVLACCSNLG